MLNKNDIAIINKAVDDISLTRWAMDRSTRMDVAKAASTAVLAAHGLTMASADADAIIKDIRDVLGLKTPADVRLTHGALGK